jgi:uncharacterized protein (TIGR03086 family)
VHHLVEWLPGMFFGTWELTAPAVPPVDDDPAAAWAVVDRAIQAALDDPAVAGAVRATPMGPMSFEDAVAMICTPDVLVHTWDLARATGLDEQLDAEEVHRQVVGVEAIDPAVDDAMRSSGHYGPRVRVAPDADEQTRLLAFMGRQP